MTMKKTLIIASAYMALLFGMFGVSHAMRLLTEEEALKQMFPDVDQVAKEQVTFTADEITKLKARLGGKLVHFQAGSESKSVSEKTTYTFYLGKKGDKVIRMAMIDEQPGKWGPVQYILALDTATGKIQNLAVMEYSEKRGRPIARQNFLSQFVGKTSTDLITINKDIRAISGATISSDATCFVVKLAIAVYQEVYQPRSKAVTKK